jgi:hypothetical protein
MGLRTGIRFLSDNVVGSIELWRLRRRSLGVGRRRVWCRIRPSCTRETSRLGPRRRVSAHSTAPQETAPPVTRAGLAFTDVDALTGSLAESKLGYV